MAQTCRVHIRKEAYKFSCAHMTVFADGSKERLHGHNYQVSVDLTLPQTALADMVPFQTIKDEIRTLSKGWDEYVLLAADCPFFQIDRKSATEIEFHLCGRRYVLPLEDVVLLPTDNIVVETLAALFCRELVARLSAIGTHILGVSVRIDETAGQGASVDWLAE